VRPLRQDGVLAHAGATVVVGVTSVSCLWRPADVSSSALGALALNLGGDLRHLLAVLLVGSFPPVDCGGAALVVSQPLP
jgi:hypothetical protein